MALRCLPPPQPLNRFVTAMTTSEMYIHLRTSDGVIRIFKRNLHHQLSAHLFFNLSSKLSMEGLG